MVVGDWLARRSSLTPDKVALIDTLSHNREITYHDWNMSANQTSNFLQQRFGIGKGDRVAILSKNCVEYLDTWFAIGKLGGILQNLNWRLSGRELTGLIQKAKPEILIYDDTFSSLVNQLRNQGADIGEFVALNECAQPGDISFGERIEYSTESPEPVNIRWNDPWVICYTGGTTGIPKGAVLSHRSITANAVNTIISWGMSSSDVTILNSPLFHTGGLNVFTAPLVYNGGTSIVCHEFDLEQTFNLLTSGQVTIWFGVPTMFIMMQNHPCWTDADFSNLKLLIRGGAPCPTPVFEEFWKKGVDFKTGYGLTEAGPNTFWLPPADVRRKPGSVGFPLFHVDVNIVREDDTECLPDEIGELIIHGPHVFNGYWDDPQATSCALHPLATDPGGVDWLRTGDLARMDEEGYYYIVGRLKDMFISGGENVFPAEIESILHSHPDIVEAAIVGIPHQKWGEVGLAFIVVKKGRQLSKIHVLDFLRDNLARYKVPKSVVFLDQLPKTGANKIDKIELINLYSEST